MHGHDSRWDLRLDDVAPRHVDTDEDYGFRVTLERGLLLLVVVAFVAIAAWQVLTPVVTMWADMAAALQVAGGR